MSPDPSYEERSRPREGQGPDQTHAHERYEEAPEETAADGKRCPNCGYHCIATADICEACGHWLLEGQCRYCYQPFKPGQRFCTSCGNPPDGIVCKQCNTKTNFDVCPTCHIPLSRRAAPAQEAMREQERLIVDAVQQMMSVVSAEEAALGKEKTTRLKKALGQLEDYYSQDPPAGSGGGPSTPSFGFTGEHRDFSAELHKGKEAEQARADKALAEAQRQAEDQARIAGVLNRIEQVKHEKANALLAEKIMQLQDRIFSDAQSARMYYMQVRDVLAHIGHCETWIGWRCNVYGCVHFNGPCGCSAPEAGGQWVCASEVTFNGNPGEFVLGGIQYYPHAENPLASCGATQ
jgi:hypothetical protein